jgi:septal ring factor EnvC (AmiA/AmiB activator)
MDWADQERATIGRLRERRRQYEQAVTERLEALEQREAELRARLESDEDVVAWLAEHGEERVERAARELGWIEQESDGVASAA